jgi:hypothetical protein
MLVGSAIGAVTNRKNPLQGALLGGALGGAGGAFMGTNGLSNIFSFADDAAGVLPSALSGSTTVAGSSLPSGAVQAFTSGPSAAMQAANLTTGPSGVIGAEAAKTGLFGGATPLTNPAMQGQGLAQTAAIQRPLTYGMPGVEYGQGGSPTIMERFGQVGQYAQQNPVLSQMAMQSAQQLLRQPEAPIAPAGQINRGQIQPMDYTSLLNPQQSTVLRPQPISLLG